MNGETDWRSLLTQLHLPPTSAGIAHAAAQLRLLGAYNRAAEGYREVLRREPGHQTALRELAVLMRILGHATEARDLEARLLEAEAEQAFLLGEQWLSRGGCTEARSHLHRCLAAAPDHPGARFLLAALGEGPLPAQAPARAIALIHDRQATRYDWWSANVEERCAPAAIHAALASWLERRKRPLEVADLGCGSGLAAQGLGGRAHRIHGVDLSPGMLDQARRRQIYASLTEADFTAWLGLRPGPYDLVVASEAFTHQGELGAVCRAVSDALRPGGLFACSVERTDAATYQLRRDGRYYHNPFYLRQSAHHAGLCLRTSRHLCLRRSTEGPVYGDITVFERRPRAVQG